MSRPELPTGADEPVFREPWEAQVFALAVRLNEAGVFSWTEWADALSAEIAAAGESGTGRYYEHWLAALERLLEQKAIVEKGQRLARAAAWDHAARRTPHGQPIELQPIDVSPGNVSRSQ